MYSKPLIIETSYNAPVLKVWKALTDVYEMKQWYFNIAEFKAEPGFEFSFDAGEDVIYTHLCKVLEVIFEKKLSYSWRYKDYAGNSVVTFELFDEGDKTRFKLTHEGLESFPHDKKDFTKESFAQGWTFITGTSLKNYLEN